MVSAQVLSDLFSQGLLVERLLMRPADQESLRSSLKNPLLGRKALSHCRAFQVQTERCLSNHCQHAPVGTLRATECLQQRLCGGLFTSLRLISLQRRLLLLQLQFQIDHGLPGAIRMGANEVDATARPQQRGLPLPNLGPAMAIGLALRFTTSKSPPVGVISRCARDTQHKYL